MHGLPVSDLTWIWLPGEARPVVAGKLEADNGNIRFNYGKSYLERIHDTKPAIPIHKPELPLKPGVLSLLERLRMPGCIRDAAPDAWGRRVIIHKKLRLKGAGTDTAALDDLAYLLESGSDRIGALDFQRSPSEYVPRTRWLSRKMSHLLGYFLFEITLLFHRFGRI